MILRMDLYVISIDKLSKYSIEYEWVSANFMMVWLLLINIAIYIYQYIADKKEKKKHQICSLPKITFSKI